MRYRRNFLPVIASGKSDDEYARGTIIKRNAYASTTPGPVKCARAHYLPRIRNK